MNLLKLTSEVVRIGNLLLIRINHLQQTVVAVVSPLRHVGRYRLVRHNHRAAGLRHLAHLAIEILNGTCSVLTEHQATDTVLRGVAATIVILHIVPQVVRIVDTRQTLIVVIVGDELAFLRKVGSLLCKHIAESIISETCNAACRMVHLSTAVTHVVSRGRYIALRVGDTDKALYAVILKRGGNLAVRTALLDGLQGLATAIGMGSLNILECVCYGCNKCMTAVVNCICRSCRRVVRQCH
jgi:hypothetical protein